MGVMDILARAGRRFAGDGETLMGSFIGPESRAFDWKRLANAIRAEREGVDRDTIWMHNLTGRRGPAPDDEWMQEIPDNLTRTNFAEAIGSTSPRVNVHSTVGEIVEGPGILDAYPEARALPVRIHPSVDGVAPLAPVRATARPEQGHWAYLSAPYARRVAGDPLQDASVSFSRIAANDISGRPSMIHELGHYGALRENFDVGTTPEYVKGFHDIAAENYKVALALKSARDLIDRGKVSSWDEAFDFYFHGPREKDLFHRWMLDNGEPDADTAALLLKQAESNPWRQSTMDRYLANRDETFQRITAESVDMGAFERAMVPPWERMKMLEWGPQNESDLWTLRLRPNDQARRLEARARVDDEIGRLLGDALRTGAGAGGVAGALSLAKNARRKEQSRDRVTA